MWRKLFKTYATGAGVTWFLCYVPHANYAVDRALDTNTSGKTLFIRLLILAPICAVRAAAWPMLVVKSVQRTWRIYRTYGVLWL